MHILINPSDGESRVKDFGVKAYPELQVKGDIVNRDDELLFADETVIERQEDREPWKIVIADDEEEVHAVTRMVLDNLRLKGEGLNYSVPIPVVTRKIIAPTPGYRRAAPGCCHGRGHHRT